MRKAILFFVGGSLMFLQATVGRSQQLRHEQDQCNANTQITPPKYRIAARRDIKEADIVILHISIEPAKTDRGELIALACSLGKDLAKQKDMQVWIFNNNKLARSYIEYVKGNSNEAQHSLCGVYLITHHGVYAGQELEIRSDPKSYYMDTVIDLGQPPS
jgi:hypothetical protein